MKEKLTLRNAVILCAAFIGLLFFFLGFAVKGKLSFVEGGTNANYYFSNAIWCDGYVKGFANGVQIVEGEVTGKPFALPIVGIVMLLLAVIAAVVVTFALKDKKVQKIALISAGAFALIGGIFVFFVGESAVRTYYYLNSGTLEGLSDFKNAMKAIGASWGPNGLGVVTGIFFILVGCAFGAAPFLPEKKLLK